MPEVFDLSQPIAACRLVGLGGDVDRQAELAMENAHAAGVVNVVVGNQNGIDAGDVPAMSGQPLLGLAPADPGVEQQLDAAGFHIDAVAVAAGLERNDVHGPLYCEPQVHKKGFHRMRLLIRSDCPNFRCENENGVPLRRKVSASGRLRERDTHHECHWRRREL